MQCPKCTTLLLPRVLARIHANGCTACGGLWLERQSLADYVRHGLAERGLPHDPVVLLEMPSRATTLHCPRCPTQQLQRLNVRGVEVERCPSCQGVFLDAGEAECIAERTIYAARADLQRQRAESHLPPPRIMSVQGTSAPLDVWAVSDLAQGLGELLLSLFGDLWDT